jgi:hypothetical protein
MKSRSPGPSALLQKLKLRRGAHVLAHPVAEHILDDMQREIHFALMALEAQSASSETMDIADETWASIAKIANLVQFAADYQADVFDAAEVHILETGCLWMQQIADRAHADRGWHASATELAGVTPLVALMDAALPRFSTFAVAMGYSAMNRTINRLRAQRGGVAACTIIDRSQT